jgi:hypothetical protein
VAGGDGTTRQETEEKMYSIPQDKVPQDKKQKKKCILFKNQS